MAMCLFTKDEFEEHLQQNLGLTKTEHKTNTAEVWQTASGRVVLAPMLDGDGNIYPDYLLNEVYEQVKNIEESG